MTTQMKAWTKHFKIPLWGS